jgi:aminomethyltransferase
MAPLRRSPLDDRHRALGAKMTEFGGWEMALDYGSVVGEHTAVRDGCGVFDLSHLGTVRVTGPEAEACVQRSFTNDAAALAPGRAHYTLLLDEAGGILDDLICYRLDWGFLAVPNAANAGDVIAALEANADGASVVDVKDDLACVAVQGPGSADALTQAGVPVSGLSFMDCQVLPLATPGADAVEGVATGAVPDAGMLARTGYTGETGYELFVPADEAPALWDRLTEAGATPAGLGCRDTLRLEMGYPLHGQDVSRQTSPVEARLVWAVKPGTGFVGEDGYAAAKNAGPKRCLWGLRVTGRGVPRAGCEVVRDGVAVGVTTSGTFSPTLKAGIAMGYLDAGIDRDDTVEIRVRDKSLEAVVTRPPFVDSSPKD